MFATHPRLALLATLITPINMSLGEAYRQDRSLAEKWKAGDWVVETWGTGWWLQTFFIFHFIYGMSSFPLTFTPSFFKMGTLHHQPGKNNRNKNSQACVCLGLYTFSGTGSTVPVRLVAEAAGFPYLGIPRWANISDLDLCTVPSIIRYPSQSLFYIYLLYIYIFEWSCSFLLFVYCTYCSLYILIMLTYRVAMAQETRALLLLL